MTVKRIVLGWEAYGLPTKEHKTDEDVCIKCFYKKFIHNGTYPFNKIKHIHGNLFAIESDVFKWHNYCFRPEWYQYLKIGLCYLSNKKTLRALISFVKFLITKI